jgi:uncharacterized protein
VQERSSASAVNGHDGPRLPTSLARCKQWLNEHHMTLVAIADTPHSVSLGTAIGVFFGFTPLFSLKTLLSIAAAWVLRCNKLAAAIAANVHDILFFLMPAVYFAEYKLGCWILQRPPPSRVGVRHLGIYDYLNWRLFSHVLWPMLLGSLLIAIPSAVIIYFVVRTLVARTRSS